VPAEAAGEPDRPQSLRLTELLQDNLKAVRAYLLKEEFQQFWEYVSPKWAEKLLDERTAKVMRSRLAPWRKSPAHCAVIATW
jgi:transposase